MEQTVDKPTIINWALNDIGAYAQFSIDDQSELAEKCNAAWQLAIGRAFGLHDWSFCRRTTKLARLAETPETGWTYAHQLSGDALGPPLKLLARAGSSPEPLRDFAIEGNLVFSECIDVWAREKVLVDPGQWTPPFLTAFTTALAGYLAISVSHDENMRDMKLAEAFGSPSQGGAGGLFGRLVAQDRAGAPLGANMAESAELVTTRQTAGAWYGRW